jgi:hypothetical protein
MAYPFPNPTPLGSENKNWFWKWLVMSVAKELRLMNKMTMNNDNSIEAKSSINFLNKLGNF